jgi:hypothetical protein
MDIFNDLLNQLLSAKAEVLVAVLCIVVGYACRKFKAFPNRFIPLACLVVGGGVYPLLVPTGDVSYEAAHPTVRCVIIGLIIGFVVWTLHKAILKPLEAKFPWLTNFLDGSSGNSDPEAFKKTTETK